MLVGVGVFGWLTWASVTDQATYASSHISEFEHELLDKLPPWMRDAAGRQDRRRRGCPVGAGAVRAPFARSAVSALVVSVLALHPDDVSGGRGAGDRDWLLAFVPKAKRGKAEQTIAEAQRVIFAYVAGNVLTSVMAALFVLIMLSVMKVPAALLLALIAGMFDFVPVIGFIASSCSRC